MQPTADYDRIAATYDRRYEDNTYEGVEQALAAFVGEGRPLRVLEVGCGTGHWLRVLWAMGVAVAGLDASPEMLRRAKTRAPNAALIRGAADRLPYKSEAFDRLFCVNAVHHFHDKPAFMREARRVLRHGGRIMTIGLDPHTALDRWFIYEYFESTLPTDRRRYASAPQIAAWMHDAGFGEPVTREVQRWDAHVPAPLALAGGRLERHATSQLSLLSDEEYGRGMSKLQSDLAAAEARGETLYLHADLRLYATTAVVR